MNTNLTKKTILIVDDDTNIVNLLKSFVAPLGHEIATAADGMEGLQLARTLRPNLILLDVMLPKLDGYKISRFLKFDEDYKMIPIVMLTAKSDEHDEIIGMQTGADAYCTKPFTQKNIIDLINKHIT